MSKVNEIRKNITDKIIKSLEEGTAPWRRPWNSDPNCGLPTNVSSQNGYKGINFVLLSLASLDREYTSKWWGTYKQWNGLGVKVKKRPKDVKEWGLPIVIWKPCKKKSENEEEEKTFLLAEHKLSIWDLKYLFSL